jgi:hypothetical protein
MIFLAMKFPLQHNTAIRIILSAFLAVICILYENENRLKEFRISSWVQEVKRK